MVRRMELHPLVAGFDGIAEQYEHGRPGYPQDVAREIADAAGGPRLLDLGAGTGKLSGPLLALGRDVVAVEPLATMRAVLARVIGAERVHAGTAEALPLEDASVDGVVCADAWHWFDGPRATSELHRVVRPGGGVVVCTLIGTAAPEAPVARAMREVLESLRAEANHPLAQGHQPDTRTLDWTPPGFEGAGFAPLERRDDLELVQHTDRERLVAHAASISFVNALAPERRAGVLADLDAALRAAGVEQAEMPYRATLWITRRRP